MQRTLQQPMHPDDLMRPDLLSELLLLGISVAVVVALSMVMVATIVSWMLQS
jgi:hypothetical protein